MVEKACDDFMKSGSGGFRRQISLVDIDIMNIVYRPSLQKFQSRSVASCMFQTMIRKMCVGLMDNFTANVWKVYFLVDNPINVIRQKNFSTLCRSISRQFGDVDMKRYDFDDELNFSWKETFAHKSTNSMSGFFLCVAWGFICSSTSMSI